MTVHIGVVGEGVCSRATARSAERVGTAIARANRWVTIPVVTGMDEARNVVLVRSCDAVIAVGGSYGTLSEIALALKLGVPVVGLRTWLS
jgi:predicted Rossmann-fold nucleotide-binding protein